MKKSDFYPLLIALSLNLEITGQNDSSDITAWNDTEMYNLKVESQKSFNFTEVYEINTSNGKMAKILGDAEAFTAPSLRSVKEKFTIPQGSVVESYKYFPKEASWAVKYNEHWCFVSATLIMPIREKAQESEIEAYDEAPKMLSGIQISYPAEAKKNGITGKVYLNILVSKTGSVVQAQVIKSIPELDAAALEAIKKIKFKPGKYQGKPVEAWIRLPINFALEK